MRPSTQRLCALIGLLSLVGGTVHAQQRRPNIVVIVSDDMGYADLGIHGSKDIPTPNIDALAGRGVRFTDAYVTGPYCSPTRAGLLTGRYPQRFGHEFNPAGATSGDGLPITEKTIADRLRAAGYRTALVGKWHLGFDWQFHPLERGFDEFFGFLGGAHSYVNATPRGPNALLDGRMPVPEVGYLTDAFGERAVDFIRRQRDRPFFLYLAFNAVHTPMQATDKYLARFGHIADPQRRTYAAMLAAMDDAVGKTLEALRAEGLEEKTLVIFMNDNGGPTMATSSVNGSSNAPLRGSKRQTFEGGIRVPFIISWKGRLPQGRIDDRPIIQLDVLPTVLAAAGIEVKPEWQLDGVDLLPYLTGQKAGQPHAALYWRFGEHMAIRKGEWKLVKSGEGRLRDVDHAAERDLSTAALYNLASDIAEKNDLARDHPEKVAELAAAWRHWNQMLARPLWGPSEIRLDAVTAGASISVNGTTLTYHEQGSGTPVVFLHGALMDRRIWGPQRQAVADEHRFIAPSLRYFGTEPWPDNGEKFSADTHVADVAAFIRELRAGPVVLVGWSYGGSVALLLAMQHPELVRGLFLYEPPAVSAVTDRSQQQVIVEELQTNMAGVQASLKAGDNNEAVRRFVDFVSHVPGAMDSLPPPVRTILLQNARTVPLVIGRPPPELLCANLAQIKLPTVVARGELTRRLFRVSAEAVQKCIPGAELKVIPGAGHAAPFENAVAFNEALLAFLSRN